MTTNSSETIASVMSLGGRPVNSRREIKIIDMTLRDAHQSLWATCMRTEHIVSMAGDFDKVGFEQVDLVAPIQFDVAVRYLKEDPWERVRLAYQHAPNTTFRATSPRHNVLTDLVARPGRAHSRSVQHSGWAELRTSRSRPGPYPSSDRSRSRARH